MADENNPGNQPNPGQGGAGGNPPQNTPWYGATPDAETLGYLQTHGLDKMDATKAAMTAMKMHRDAEKLIGAGQENLLRIPAKGDVKAWGDVWTKLGRPAEAKDYDFSVFKDGEGKPLLDEHQTNTLRDLAYSLNLSKDAATILVQKLSAISAEEAKQDAASGDADRAMQVAELKNNWGGFGAANRVVADNAAKAFGLDPAVLDTKGDFVKIPFAQANELFRQIGLRMREDGFVQQQQQGPGAHVTMSKEQAQYRLTQLKNDKLWLKRYDDGDAVAAKEFNDLTNIVTFGEATKG